MRRIVLWVASTVTVVVLMFGYHTSTSGVLAASGQTPYASSSTPAPTTSRTTSGTARTVTGSVAQTQWGPVQVRLSMHGSTISSVTVVQYPQGNSRDDQINSYALPILIQETTDAQSAQIDMVSGATVTSTGYLQSLQSALDQA